MRAQRWIGMLVVCIGLSGCFHRNPLLYYDLVGGMAEKRVYLNDVYPPGPGRAIASAIADRDYAKLRRLAADPALVNIEGPHRLTPLWIAVELKDIEATRILLEAGANPSVQTTYLEPSIITALRNEWTNEGVGIFDLLMDYHANPNLRYIMHGGHETPAISSAHYSKEKIKRLLDAGADLNARNSSGFTPLLLTTGPNPREIEAAIRYLDLGADWKLKGPKGDIFEQMQMFISLRPENRKEFEPIYAWFRERGIPYPEPTVPQPETAEAGNR